MRKALALLLFAPVLIGAGCAEEQRIRTAVAHAYEAFAAGDDAALKETTYEGGALAGLASVMQGWMLRSGGDVELRPIAIRVKDRTGATATAEFRLEIIRGATKTTVPVTARLRRVAGKWKVNRGDLLAGVEPSERATPFAAPVETR